MNKSIVFFILVVCFTYCSKDKNDFRDEYTGTYNFLTTVSCFKMSDSTSTYDSIKYLGRIYYTEDLELNELIIENLPDYSYIMQVNDSGLLSQEAEDHFFGSFISKSEINFGKYEGGHGGGCYTNVTGLKQ